jgi:TonB family protein
MKCAFLRRSAPVFSLFFLLSFVFCELSYGTTPVDLDNLAEKLAPEIDKSSVKSIAVVDFVSADGMPTDLGWYLANKLSDSIALKSPATLIIDRTRLQQLGLASGPSATADDLKRIGVGSNADAIASGKIEITPEKYLITVTLLKAADGSTLASVTHSLPHSRMLDLLSPAGDHALVAKPARAGVMGVGVPACLYCPVPANTAQWRSNQPQNVILQVVISIAGSAEKISVVRSPGYFLSERAVEAVSDWKFRPAPGEDGKPTTVIVPIEVTFKPLRT